MSSIKSAILPAAANTLISTIVTYPPWAKFPLLGLEYPSFIIAVISAVIGSVLALQFSRPKIVYQFLFGFIFCCTVLGYYTIWSMTGSPVYLIYLAVFLIFLVFLIGSYFLTVLQFLLFRIEHTNKEEQTD